jgi:peptide-methionine (R)-S-oxide reductase
MAGNYRKDPETVSRLTPEQYRITQQDGAEPESAHKTGSAS